jgi:hypothetical protein
MVLTWNGSGAVTRSPSHRSVDYVIPISIYVFPFRRMTLLNYYVMPRPLFHTMLYPGHSTTVREKSAYRELAINHDQMLTNSFHLARVPLAQCAHYAALFQEKNGQFSAKPATALVHKNSGPGASKLIGLCQGIVVLFGEDVHS